MIENLKWNELTEEAKINFLKEYKEKLDEANPYLVDVFEWDEEEDDDSEFDLLFNTSLMDKTDKKEGKDCDCSTHASNMSIDPLQEMGKEPLDIVKAINDIINECSDPETGELDDNKLSNYKKTTKEGHEISLKKIVPPPNWFDFNLKPDED